MQPTPTKQPALDYAPPPPSPFARLRRPVTLPASISMLLLPLTILAGHFSSSLDFDVYSFTYINYMPMTANVLLISATCAAPALITIALALTALLPLKRNPPVDDLAAALLAIALSFWWLLKVALGIHALYHIYIPWL